MATRTPARRGSKATAKPRAATAKGTTKGKAKSRSTAPARPRRVVTRAPAATKSTAAAPKRTTKPEKGPGQGLGHGRDLAGLALVVAGVLIGLAVFADLAGPAGSQVADAAATAFGGGRVFLPFLVVAAGALVLWRRPSCEPVRLAVGLSVLLAGVCGLLHVLRDGPAWDGATADAMADAGGGAGLALGEPLRAVLGPWGAGLVLGTVIAAALLVVTRTTARDAFALVGRGVTAVWRAIADVGRLAREREDPEGEVAAASKPSPVMATPVPEPEPEPVVVTPPVPDAPISVHVPSGPEAKGEQLAIDLGPAAEKGTWKLPPLSLLKRGAAQRIDHKLVEAEGRALEAALAAHGVETRLVGMTVGPTVTRYELELGAGVKVARVTNLHKDIAYAMASADVRILAPIPGRSAIGVEVPNKQRELVLLGDVLASADAQRATHPLETAMGRDIAGRGVMVNLADMPHVLIAGATGVGSSRVDLQACKLEYSIVSPK